MSEEEVVFAVETEVMPNLWAHRISAGTLEEAEAFRLPGERIVKQTTTTEVVG